MESKLSLHGLTLPFPEGFHVMDEAEWSRMKLLANGEGAGLSDKARHMIVTVDTSRRAAFPPRF